MDPSALPRLRAWLEHPEIIALDPRRIEALAAALGGHDPPVRVERWGTVVGYEAGPPRRRLVQFDRHGHLIAACRWSPNGGLDWARSRAADGRWVGVEPGATEHPAWGRSDRVWLLDGEESWGEEPWRPVEPLSVFRSLDWTALDHIPPLAEPQRLPPGAGSAVMNLVAALMKDQGAARVRYRGPFASEQLFTTLPDLSVLPTPLHAGAALQEAVRPKWSGTIVYRCLIPMEKLQAESKVWCTQERLSRMVGVRVPRARAW